MASEQQPDSWATIEYFYDPTEAHIAAGRLESEGIPVFLLGINYASANWLIATALGGIQLQVPGSFELEAREIFAAMVSEQQVEEELCPGCGGANISVLTRS